MLKQGRQCNTKEGADGFAMNGSFHFQWIRKVQAATPSSNSELEGKLASSSVSLSERWGGREGSMRFAGGVETPEEDAEEVSFVS